MVYQSFDSRYPAPGKQPPTIGWQLLPSTEHEQKKNTIHEFIKDLESFNRYTKDIDRARIRNTIIPHFHRFLYRRNEQNTIESKIISLHRSTKKFRKENPNVIFTRADKGNVTVAIDREHYIKKIEETLKDKNTYAQVRRNPIKNIERNLNSTIKRWWNKGHISKQSYLSLFSMI